MSEVRPSFWQQWKPLIILFSFGLAFLASFYAWTAYQAKQPIDPVYEKFLGQLAEASSGATRYREKYYRHVGRDTVASQDFLTVCAGMTHAAKTEGVEPARFNDNLATLCENAQIYINSDFLR